MPAIITGDFNCTPGEEPLQTLEKGGMENAAKTAAVTYGPSWSFHDFGRLPVKERVLLDYVFVTKGAKIDATALSKTNRRTATFPTTVLYLLN